MLSGWWIAQRYSHEVVQDQISRADYYLQGFLASEEALHTTSVKGIITDFGFRRTVADGDPATIASMLDNHARRVGLDFLLITDRKGKGLSSFGSLMDEDQNGRIYHLLKETPERPRILALKNGFYWLYLSAIKAPHVVGYAIAGTAIDINRLKHIKSITGLDLSLSSTSMGYSLTTHDGIGFNTNSRDNNDGSSFWKRHRFVSRQIDISSLPTEDIKLYMSADLQDFHQQFDHFTLLMLSVTAVVVILITMISMLLSRRMFKPMEHLHKKLLHRASFDHLTGIHNRITASEFYYRMLMESQRSQQPFFIALLDIDHFKIINDTYGHAAGDAVLIEISRRLKDGLREYDILGRHGGEEFIIAGNLPIVSCQNHLIRVKKLISERPFRYKDQLLSVTISIGACYVDFSRYSQMLTPDTLLEWADQALYEAKDQGRNRVVIKQHHAKGLDSCTLI